MVYLTITVLQFFLAFDDFVDFARRDTKDYAFIVKHSPTV